MGVMEVVEGNWASKGEVQAVAMGRIIVRFQSGTRIDKIERYDRLGKVVRQACMDMSIRFGADCGVTMLLTQERWKICSVGESGSKNGKKGKGSRLARLAGSDHKVIGGNGGSGWWWWWCTSTSIFYLRCKIFRG